MSNNSTDSDHAADPSWDPFVSRLPSVCISAANDDTGQQQPVRQEVHRSFRRGSELLPAGESLGSSPRLPRGFTITVSSAEVSDKKDGFKEGGVGWGSALSVDEDVPAPWLAPDPDGYMAPEYSIERTESRLPSLGEMLADEELAKMLLRSTPEHQELSDALTGISNVVDSSAGPGECFESKETEDDAAIIVRLRALVVRAAQDPAWRHNAFGDKKFLDSAVLFLKQRLANIATLRNTGVEVYSPNCFRRTGTNTSIRRYSSFAGTRDTVAGAPPASLTSGFGASSPIRLPASSLSSRAAVDGNLPSSNDTGVNSPVIPGSVPLSGLLNERRQSSMSQTAFGAANRANTTLERPPSFTSMHSDAPRGLDTSPRAINRTNSQLSSAGLSQDSAKRILYQMSQMPVMMSLLRNLCVCSADLPDSAEYLREHHLMEALFQNIDLFLEALQTSRISTRAKNADSSQTSSLVEGLEYDAECAKTYPAKPPSTLSGGHTNSSNNGSVVMSQELDKFFRVLLQLAQNVLASASATVKETLFRQIYPVPTAKLLAQDRSCANLMACLVNTLTCHLAPAKLHEYFVANPQAPLFWWLLLSSGSSSSSFSSSSSPSLKPPPDTQDTGKAPISETQWISILLENIVTKDHEKYGSLLAEVIVLLETEDPQAFTFIQPHLLSTSPRSSFAILGRSGSGAQFSATRPTLQRTFSGSLLLDETLLLGSLESIEGASLEAFLYRLIFEALDNSKETQLEKLPFIASQSVRSFLIEKYVSAVDTLEHSAKADATDKPPLESAAKQPLKKKIGIAEKCLPTLIECLAAAARHPAIFGYTESEILIDTAILWLKQCQSNVAPLLRQTTLDTLLLIGNLIAHNPDRLASALSNDLEVILSCAHMDIERPAMEEAAIYVIKSCCVGSDENRNKIREIIKSTKHAAASKVLSQI